MQNPISQNAESSRPWNLVVLYDERSACRRAVSTVTKMIPDPKRLAVMRSTAWRFSDIEDSDRGERVLAAISTADLIVVAPSADTPVPMELIERLGRSLANISGRVPTVMTVCDPTAGADDSSQWSATLLRRVASTAGLVASGAAAQRVSMRA